MLDFLRKRTAANTSSVVGDKCVAENVSSVRAAFQADKTGEGSLIDVRRVIAESSVEELCESADEYYRKLKQWDYHLAKPFGVIGEMPEIIIPFVHLLQSMNVVAGMRILDFGAGTCWASHLLTQAGCEVIALDASARVLEIGRELYARQPIIGEQPAPQFLVFDGHTIDLPDASLDRIICLDAFHHVPNQARVLAEMSRVLCNGGIAGFSEPGPEHSTTPQSQYEMRMYRVVENDVKLEDIWNDARQIGFTDIKLSIHNPKPFVLSLAEFGEYLAGGEPVKWYAEAARHYMLQHRTFLLFKGVGEEADSRQRDGLSARLDIHLAGASVVAGESFVGTATITNTGKNIWLPTAAGKGAVHLGIHLFGEDGALLELDYMRHLLTPGEGRAVRPGETVIVDFTIGAPPKGRYIVEFDLVSEQICWFENNGSPTVKCVVEVI